MNEQIERLKTRMAMCALGMSASFISTKQGWSAEEVDNSKTARKPILKECYRLCVRICRMADKGGRDDINKEFMRHFGILNEPSKE